MSAGDFIGMVGHAGGFYHGIGIVPVYLDADGCLLGKGFHFGDGLCGVADQPVRRDEFGIDGGRPLLAAEDTEGGVRNILHRGQQNRFFPQVYVSDFHSDGKGTKNP